MNRRQFPQISTAAAAASSIRGSESPSSGFRLVHFTDTRIQKELKADEGVAKCFGQIAKLSQNSVSQADMRGLDLAAATEEGSAGRRAHALYVRGSFRNEASAARSAGIANRNTRYPDLHKIALTIYSATYFPNTIAIKRSYEHGIREFIEWCCSEPSPALQQDCRNRNR
jgi:hypothetical protein